MQPGKLRHRIQIQRATEANANGEMTRTWATLTTRWASIKALSGKELYEAQQVQARATYSVKMRYYAGLLTSDRLRDVTITDGIGSGSGSGSGTGTEDDIQVNLTLNIEHITNEMNINRELTILCSEAAG